MFFQRVLDNLSNESDEKLATLMDEVIEQEETGVLPEGEMRALADSVPEDVFQAKHVRLRLLREAVIREAALRWHKNH